MGPHESPTRHPENQAPLRRRRSARRARTRRCLLKGCEERFHPRRSRQRYCSDRCRAAAREWSRWKAQQKYRATTAGKRRRNGQSCRYRERVRSRRQPPQEEAIPEPARVITNEFFRFFDDCCDRPGCYEGFRRQPRSPLQRFCSHQCQRAVERVWERERHWRRTRQQTRAG
jgi:hypothetical protein